MGVFDEDFVRRYVDLSEYPICVETGTNLGYSTDKLLGLFSHVYTVEIEPALYERAAHRYAGQNVTCILGDSAEELPRLIPSLFGPTFFFLDAHWSGDATVEWSTARWGGYGVDTGHRGEPGTLPNSADQVPLLLELAEIMKFPGPCAVYIDDMDKFDAAGMGTRDLAFKGEDWSAVSLPEILGVLRGRSESIALSATQLLVTLNAI